MCNKQSYPTSAAAVPLPAFSFSLPFIWEASYNSFKNSSIYRNIHTANLSTLWNLCKSYVVQMKELEINNSDKEMQLFYVTSDTVNLVKATGPSFVSPSPTIPSAIDLCRLLRQLSSLYYPLWYLRQHQVPLQHFCDSVIISSSFLIITSSQSNLTRITAADRRFNHISQVAKRSTT